ncbi:MAG TPA: hypothetical protein VG456_26730 [Candidatus Sulfopaludibacter sp.]|nr:hypothetical protein [Candidatus Sulfopaludibacter sp.]
MGAVIAGVRRKQPIGGWLYFFFWQVALSCAITLIYSNWAEFAPRLWEGQFKYLLHFLVSVPRLTALFAVAIIGAMLLRSHAWQWVIILRYALTILCILGVLSVAVDVAYFPNRVGLEVATLIFPAAYLIYFFVSVRVRTVFRADATSLADPGERCSP